MRKLNITIRKIEKIILIFLFLPSPIFSQTEIYIGVERKVSQEKDKIVFFKKAINEETQKAYEIIRNDIMFSDYMNVVEIEDMEESSDTLKRLSQYYKYFLGMNVDKKDPYYTVKAMIYNLEKNKKIEKIYTADERSFRRVCHFISDSILENTVEKKGIASSRIVFSNNSTGYKEIYMIDYDGENLVQLTNHRSISIVPRWSNDGTKIYYTTYKYRNPDMAVIDLNEGKIKLFSKFQGLNIPGGFSPDGTKFAVILSRGKDPSVYVIDLVSREVKNILENFGVCASPTFSPDGKEIAFVSDRAGNPQLYIYNIDTKSTRKITNFYWVDSPSWSPDGKWIAFAARQTRQEKLNIFITDPTTSIIKRLTRNEGDNEDPTFSPDSRYIAFISTRNGRRQLFVMDTDGSRPHLLSKEIKGDCFTPNWSR